MAEDIAVDQDTVKVLVYSDDANTRREVLQAVGHKVGNNLPEIAWTEVATPEMAVFNAQDTTYDLMILDGEAPKLGGMGLGKMIHDEVDPKIPFIVLLGRPQDEWLSRWSGATAAVSYPINPRELSETVARALQARK
ncbi:MAG: hypothetical protein LKJ57_05125 [Ancrocorticia sp.]|jgi:Response regulator containing a CheY-like receiver domain and a GGDEF domain|nr:hypothetical protein [Ancrocorticia sp.]MCI1895860.1 hypothetical protein [Ancrocorticia sp.]MCI1932684.1 hypothetical protein [Ancrocorticia sp.]MCI1964255.1 hypothetical protein [Ancrocorticia sp.]MCI2002858.1 hypothetical protein [Ancrocorticia sp.]